MHRYCAMVLGEDEDAEAVQLRAWRGSLSEAPSSKGGAVVGYGAFLLLSSAAVTESVRSQQNTEIIHVVVTNAEEVHSVFGDVSEQIDVTLGTMLRTLTRSADLICRVTSASYSILIEGAPLGAGLVLADRIVRATESYNAIRGLAWPIDVTCEVLDGAAVHQVSDVFDMTL